MVSFSSFNKRAHSPLCILVLLLLSSIVSCEYTNVADEDSFIMTVIRKHDPKKEYFFDIPTYNLVLFEVIEIGMELAGEVRTSEELSDLEEAVAGYIHAKAEQIQNQPAPPQVKNSGPKPTSDDKIFTYKDVFGDLTQGFSAYLTANPTSHPGVFEMLYGGNESLKESASMSDSKKNTKNNEKEKKKVDL